MGFKILAINPGSTSTKIALYDDEQPTLALTLRHSAEEIARFRASSTSSTGARRWYSKHSQRTTST